MKKKGKKEVGFFVALMIVLFVFSGSVMGADKIKMMVSHQPEFESFLTWQGIEENVDEKYGLDLKMMYFDSGMLQVEALPARTWDVGALGAVPMVMAALRYEAYMIGMTHDDADNVFVMSRPDSEVLSVKGFNPEYPNMYGSPEKVKGKTILVTTVSAAHYVMSTWLKRLGLKDEDVKILNMEQGQAVAAFQSGKGDLVVLWAPFTMSGLSNGSPPPPSRRGVTAWSIRLASSRYSVVPPRRRQSVAPAASASLAISSRHRSVNRTTGSSGSCSRTAASRSRPLVLSRSSPTTTQSGGRSAIRTRASSGVDADSTRNGSSRQARASAVGSVTDGAST
ncbi:MAG: ABC transporter substrate-binding protein [Halohasta sp.]